MATARGQRFFQFLPSLGILVVAPFLMIAFRSRGRRNRAGWQLATMFWALVALCCLVWGLAMFSPEGAMLHIGTADLPIWAVGAAVVGLCAVSLRLGAAVAALHMVTVLALYLPVLSPLPDTEFSKVALASAGLCLAAFGWLAAVGSAATEASGRGAP